MPRWRNPVTDLLCFKKHTEEICATSGTMRLDGFISLEGAYPKVTNTRDSCVRIA